jgi:hypothetical protein
VQRSSGFQSRLLPIWRNISTPDKKGQKENRRYEVESRGELSFVIGAAILNSPI